MQKTTFKKDSEKGQLSIFLAICLIILMTLLAFIINVGLFVKAKINLQNAVDAAAWSGAATQARQLTNISYLNWELRNTYKEWMFKYYVLGQLSLDKTLQSGISSSDPKLGQPHPTNMNFRSNPFGTNTDEKSIDKFNIPSICIKWSPSVNICQIKKPPGLPIFKSVGIPGIQEIHETMVNQLVTDKAKNCSDMAEKNFFVAIKWAYGIPPEDPAASQGPNIATDLMGAWPQAFELALRMRNLEMIVNRPPVNNGICLNSTGGCTAINELDQGHDVPINERPIKAFWSAYRNLSGGTEKGGDNNTDLFSGTLKLTELSPTPFNAPSDTLSGYLIPASARFSAPNALAVSQKSYLDLQIYPLNYVTFFSFFVTTTEKNADGSGVDRQGACAASYTGIPVPAYIFGFVKNPQVLTYYAVKAEADFMGLFFPFSSGGIKLQAYASAKPFGGRVGPQLFNINDNKAITPRIAGGKSRSLPYIIGLNTQSASTVYDAGAPLPFTKNFWVQNQTDSIGGHPKLGVPKFAIPNLLYDWVDGEMDAQEQGSEPLISLQGVTSYDQTINPVEDKGLYNKKQFEAFSKHLHDLLSGPAVGADQYYQAIRNARGPTRYEALNYLIPTAENTKENINSVSQISIEGADSYALFAPLFSDSGLYKNEEDIVSVLSDYLRENEPAIQSFLEALKEASESIVKKDGGDLYKKAANSIFPEGVAPEITTVKGTLKEPCEESSLASKYAYFFSPTDAQELCGIVPFAESLKNYWERKREQDKSYALYFRSAYTKPSDIPNRTLMTAYLPGERHGVDNSGKIIHPFPGKSSSAGGFANRNFYSTKLTPLKKYIVGQQNIFHDRNIYHENGSVLRLDGTNQAEFLNPLNPQDPAVLSIKQGFPNLDF